MQILFDLKKKSCPTLKVGKYEGIIETYKKKMEEMGDLKRQIKYLEEKNSEYINVRSLLIKIKRIRLISTHRTTWTLKKNWEK